MISRLFSAWAELGKARPARDDVASVLDERGKGLLQIEDRGAAVVDRQVDDAERRLQIRHSIELALMTTWGITSFFSSITNRIPSRSLSSRASLIPSIFFSRISSPILACTRALLTW